MAMAKEEHGSHIAASHQDLEMELVLDDCRRAMSGIMHEEKMLEKKRRWLMALSADTKSTHTGYLPESFVRSDDVSVQDIRMLVQRNFRSSIESKRFKRTHLEMRITEDNPPESHAQSHSECRFEGILSHITILTTISSPLISSISGMLEVLEDLPSQALIAMNRKLRNVTVTPKFPVVFSCKRNILIDRLKKKCHKILPTLHEGSLNEGSPHEGSPHEGTLHEGSPHDEGCQLPKSLAKALSVMCLSVKEMTRRADIMTTKFFPFPPEIEDLQNEILQAVWSLPNVKRSELKHLQDLVAPDSELPMKSLRKALHNFLMEYLFHCDEVHLPKPFLMALKLINKQSQGRLLGSEETVEEEVEQILNVSSQLRQILWDSFPDKNMDQEFADAYAESSETNEGDCDIIIDENEDCSTFAYSDYIQIHESYLDDVEGIGDSMPVDAHENFNPVCSSSAQFMEGKEGVACKVNDEDQNGSSEPCHQLSPTTTNMSNSYHALKNICDETSLVAYTLIGYLIEDLVQKEDKKADESTEYLRGGSSNTSSCQDPEKACNLTENLEAIVLQVIGERIPSFPSGVLERVKGLKRQL